MKTREQWAEEVMEQIKDYAWTHTAVLSLYATRDDVLRANEGQKKLRALLLEVPESHAMTIPAGWKFVPNVLTHEMEMAGYYVACKFGVLEARAFTLSEEIYKSFIKASPEYVAEQPYKGE